MKSIPALPRILERLAISLAVFVLIPAAAHATTRNKANNTTNLNLAGSWDTLPGAADIAQWTNTVTAANTTVLGADLSWAGIKIVNPGGLVTINSGNTLTIGASGIDLSTATQNLTLNCGLTLSSGGLTKNGTNTLTLAGANTYTGTTTISGGTLVLSGDADRLPTATTLAFTGTGGTFNPNSEIGTTNFTNLTKCEWVGMSHHCTKR